MDWLKSIFGRFLGSDKQQAGSDDSAGGGFLGFIVKIFKAIFSFFGFGGNDSDQQQEAPTNPAPSTHQQTDTGGNAVWSGLVNLKNEIVEGVKDVVNNGLNSAVNTAKNWVSKKVELAKTTVKNVYHKVSGYLPTFVTDAVEKAVSFFQGKGWTKQQAVGIVANLQKESELKTNAKGDGGLAKGVAQWHPDRQKAIKDATGIDVTNASLTQQLEAVNWELTKGGEQGAGKELRSANTSDQAAAIVSKKFERPADKEGEAYRRGQLALQIDNNLKDVAKVDKPLSTPKNETQQPVIG